LCDACKAPLEAAQTQHIRAALASTPQNVFTPDEVQERPLFKPVGCGACEGGYKGRIGVYQVLPISTAMQSLILSHGNGQTLATQAGQEGIRTLRQAGWLKVLHGITSAQEVMALTAHG
jgi:type IV pilus assembly protein PilB